MTRVDIPPHVRMSAAKHGGGTLLDVRTGRWYSLNATARSLWEEMCGTGDVDTAVNRVTSHYPAELQGRVRADASVLIDMLAARRLVQLAADGRKPQAVELARSSRRPTTTADPRPIRASRRRAHAALLLALVVLRLPFGWIASFINALRRWQCRGATTIPEAQALLLAIDRVARWYPVRVACLERSLAAVLLASMHRRRLDLALGAADDPYTFHAWVEAGETPVPDTSTPDFAKYRRVLKL